jgi:hypothetical protein
MIGQLVQQSAGVGIGIFVGCLIGLGMRKRKGNSEGLLGNSVLLTASAAGGAALLAMMAIKYFSN